ncbi:MAG: aspartyl protease family protein [Chitinophagaceae bacterium]
MLLKKVKTANPKPVARAGWAVVLLCLLLSSLQSQAQEEFIPPPAKLLTSFPFIQFTGGIILIRAKVGNYPDTLNFILDTGSGGISLDSATCERLNIASSPSDRTIRGIAGIRNVRFVYNQKLHLPGLTLDSLNFHVNDYEILTSAYGEQIDGIMGYSFLSRYIVKIDYDSSVIQIFSKGTMKYPRGGFLLRPILATLPIQTAKVNDQREINSRFYFDTGAGLCLLLSTDFVQDSNLLNPKRKPVITQGEGLGGKMEMRLTTIKDFKLGPYRFKRVPTYIFEDSYNVTAYPYLGGLIGNDLLRRFNVILNYDRRDIYLVPNSHFRDPFDYSYTGLGIYKLGNEIVVVDIMKGSPAEKAGFIPGDIILAVNNNFTGNIQNYKTMMQNVGEKIRILVHRSEGPVMLILKVRSIN